VRQFQSRGPSSSPHPATAAGLAPQLHTPLLRLQSATPASPAPAAAAAGGGVSVPAAATPAAAGNVSRRRFLPPPKPPPPPSAAAAAAAAPCSPLSPKALPLSGALPPSCCCCCCCWFCGWRVEWRRLRELPPARLRAAAPPAVNAGLIDPSASRKLMESTSGACAACWEADSSAPGPAAAAFAAEEEEGAPAVWAEAPAA
jgi:hypothetical protein